MLSLCLFVFSCCSSSSYLCPPFCFFLPDICFLICSVAFFQTTDVFCMMYFAYVLCQLAHASHLSESHILAHTPSHPSEMSNEFSLPFFTLYLLFANLVRCHTVGHMHASATASCFSIVNSNRKLFFLSCRTSSSMPINFNRMRFAPSCRASSSMPINSNRLCSSLSCGASSSMLICCVWLSSVGHHLQRLLL